MHIFIGWTVDTASRMAAPYIRSRTHKQDSQLVFGMIHFFREKEGVMAWFDVTDFEWSVTRG